MTRLIFALGLLLLTTASFAQRNEIDVLSYETGLSSQFLEVYFNSARKLGIGPAEAHSIVTRMAEEIKQLRPGGRAYSRLVDASISPSDILGGSNAPQAIMLQILNKMRTGSHPMRRYLANTFRVPERMALLHEESSELRDEIDLLTYEMNISKEFLIQFQRAAGNINIGETQSLRLIKKMVGDLVDLPWSFGGYARRQLYETPGGAEVVVKNKKLLEAGDTEGALLELLRLLSVQGPESRQHLARIFGIPDRVALIYGDLKKTPETQNELKTEAKPSGSSLATFRDKDGFVTIEAFNEGKSFLVFRDAQSLSKGAALAKEGKDDPRLFLLLVSCVAPTGARARVEGQQGGDLPSVSVEITDGSKAGCRGVVPVSHPRFSFLRQHSAEREQTSKQTQEPGREGPRKLITKKVAFGCIEKSDLPAMSSAIRSNDVAQLGRLEAAKKCVRWPIGTRLFISGIIKGSGPYAMPGVTDDVAHVYTADDYRTFQTPLPPFNGDANSLTSMYELE